VNLAARLMGAAPAGQVLISRAIGQEAGPGFILKEMAPIQVKGKKAPVPVCLVEGEAPAGALPSPQTSSPLLGREDELSHLRKVCAEVEAGRGRVAVIEGELGIGKSRLAVELARHLDAHGWKVHWGRCHPHTASAPYAPWVQILSSLFDAGLGHPIAVRTQHVLTAVGRLTPDLLEKAPLLNTLLSVEVPLTDLVLSLDQEAGRRHLLDLVAALLAAAANESNHALFLEDFHWADASSLHLAKYMAERAGRSRLLVCLTRRLEGPELELAPDSTVTIRLGELPRDAAERLVCGAAGLSQLPAQVVDAIVSRARGNPLFLEEMGLSLRDSGAAARLSQAHPSQAAQEAGSLEIPDRVHAIVMSRIDALDIGAKDALRTAAVVGASFDIPTLNWLLGARPLDHSPEVRVRELVQLDLVAQEEGAQPPRFRLKHALVQQVAYDSLSFAGRRRLHHRLAAHLEELHNAEPEPLYETLAHHYRLSGDSPKTLFYSLKAGDKARQVFAHREAQEYYRLCLSTLRRLGGPVGQPSSYILERIGDCHEASGHHREAAQAFSSALRAWRAAARGAPALPSALPDLGVGVSPRARESLLRCKVGISWERNSDYAASLRWLESALRALPSRRPGEAAQVYIAKGVSLFRQGRYDSAISWGRRGLALARRSGDRRRVAYAHNMLANSYVELGRLKRAALHRHAALRLYDELGDVPGQAAANNNLGSCYQLLGILDRALHHYQLSLAACRRMGNLVGEAIVRNNMGEVLLARGREEEAVSHLEAVVKGHASGEVPQAIAGLALVNLCRALQPQQRYEEASARLEQGLSLLRKSGARGLATEALLQRAELEADMGQWAAASRSCAHALEEGRGLGSKLLEA
ncbi:MAG: AAA family ATPase, partial [Chloroflexota bacterium]|nr:AAA family ATPase [Chloroflexota bacterium]